MVSMQHHSLVCILSLHSFLLPILKKIYQVEDVLFSAGEALSFIWGDVPVTADMVLNTNYGSLSERTNYLTSEMQVSSLTTSDRSVNDNESHITAREAIIRKLFEALLYSSRKEERCAGTVWLVSLTMYCGHHKRIQELLPEIQVCCSDHNSFWRLNFIWALTILDITFCY